MAISGIKGSGIGAVAQPNEFFTRNQPAYASPYTSALEARRRQLAIENARQEEEFFAGKMGEQPSDVLYNDLYKDRIFNPNTPANRSLTQIIENPSASVFSSDPEKAPGFGLGSFTTPGGSKNTIDQQIGALSKALSKSDAKKFTSSMGGSPVTTDGTTTDGGSGSSNANQAAQVEAAGIGATSDTTGDITGGIIDDAMSNQQAQTDAAGTTSTTTETTTTPDGAPGAEAPVDPFEGILKKAMDSVAEARGEKPKKDINDYKEEFALATGVDISGKPDKSQALMALGLSLMQNKAGRGFNVSNMLGAVGEAGEKAMPAFAKAKAEARNAQIAAGKFGLQQVAADKAAQATKVAARQKVVDELLKSQLDSVEAERLENIKSYQARELERLKTELKIFEERAKPEEAREYEKDFDLTFAAGQGPATGWKIKMAYDKTMPDQAVLVNADPMMRKYIDGRAGINDALDLIDVMESSARDIAEGGGTAKFAYDKLNSAAKALFPDLNTGKPTSEEEYTQALNMIMGRFKRFLTQETGNGISNRDVDIWEREIMKKPTWFQNFDSTSNALDLLRDTFIQKREEFDAGLDHLYDSANHRDQDVFGGLVEKYGTLEQAKGLDGKLIYKDGRLVRG